MPEDSYNTILADRGRTHNVTSENIKAHHKAMGETFPDRGSSQDNFFIWRNADVRLIREVGEFFPLLAGVLGVPNIPQLQCIVHASRRNPFLILEHLYTRYIPG